MTQIQVTPYVSTDVNLMLIAELRSADVIPESLDAVLKVSIVHWMYRTRCTGLATIIQVNYLHLVYIILYYICFAVTGIA